MIRERVCSHSCTCGLQELILIYSLPSAFSPCGFPKQSLNAPISKRAGVVEPAKISVWPLLVDTHCETWTFCKHSVPSACVKVLETGCPHPISKNYPKQWGHKRRQLEQKEQNSNIGNLIGTPFDENNPLRRIQTMEFGDARI